MSIKKAGYLALTLLIVLALVQLLASTPVDYVKATTPLPGHPRILWLKGEEALVKRTIKSDTSWRKMQRVILSECDVLLAVAPLKRTKIGKRLLDTSREGLRRVFFLAYAWRITRQEKYLKRAETELLALSAFSDWNPTHFLDVAEMTMAVAIGYDWLYADLPRSTRLVLKAAILEKGIEPSLNPDYNGWLTATNNWNQVCNAGMAYGAMAIYEDQPELARQVVNRAIRSIQLPMREYSPNGAYPEGYSYWEYGTSFNVLFINALEKLVGHDFGLTRQAGFLNTAAYLENMTGPSGNAFNYSDSDLRGKLQPVMFWFAKKQSDPSLLWGERKHLLDSDPQQLVKDRLLPAIMLWSDGICLDCISQPQATMWIGKGKTPVALMRSSWIDSTAIYVGLKAGSPSTSHAHMDIGSFIMEADGIRWAMDFGMQQYESLESKGVDLWNTRQNSQRWQVFRYNNLTHNTLTVNNELQQVTGKATITGYSKNPLFMQATTNLTEVYENSLVKLIRGVALVNKEYVVIRDEFETLPEETTVRWTMLTPAIVKLNGDDSAELTKGGKTLILQVVEPAHIPLKTWSTHSTHDYDAANPETTLVGFELKVPANAKTTFTVLLLPAASAKKAKPPVQPLQKWPQ